MFSTQIYNAQNDAAKNYLEKFVVYPALAGYSFSENLVQTAVGVVFTGLSVLTLGLSENINDIANWTSSSQGLITTPLQIFLKIFDTEAKVISHFNEKIAENDRSLAYRREICEYNFNFEGLTLKEKARRHVLFRIGLIMPTIMYPVAYSVFLPIGFVIGLASAIWSKGKDQSANNLMCYTAQLPSLIHKTCLNVRMWINPTQFIPSGTIPMDYKWVACPPSSLRLLTKGFEAGGDEPFLISTRN